MKMKKQCKKKAVEETGETKGKITQRTQAIEKPSRTQKLLAKKPISGNAGVTEKPLVTGKPETAVSSAPMGKSEAEPLGIKKKFIESSNICEVTFRFPREAALKARKVTVVGDFNHWDRETNRLKKQDNGDFTITLELDAGKEYRFRYLIDGHQWENDWHADKYVENPYGVEDSVVCA
jgi:hypothetical protein